MKIVIEAQPLLRQRTGVGQYTYHLIDQLIPLIQKRNDQLSLFYFNFLKRNKTLPKWNGSVISREHFLLPGRGVYYLWKNYSFPSIEWFSGSADLFHFPNFIVRPFKKGKAVVTIHDLSFVRFPEFAEKKNLEYLNKWIPYSLQRASRVCVVSEFTKLELIEHFQVPEEKIVVTYNGVQPVYKKINDIQSVQDLKIKYKLPNEFALAVGTLEPRKNYSLLLEAYRVLKSRKESLPPLVFVGPPGWNQEYERLKEKVNAYGLSDVIQFLFYVDGEDMVSLYNGAKLLLFPSVYEGFGLPVLEAMACGTPVLCSNAASLPEVAGKAAELLPADNAEAWGNALLDLWESSGKREQYAQLGLEQAKKFTWQKTAEKTLEAYEQAIRD